jgi:hypothetical protein
VSIKAIPPAPRMPRTPREWQAAADAAEWCLALDSCRQYGLVEGGPGIDVDRCLLILERAKMRGIVPAKVESL